MYHYVIIQHQQLNQNPHHSKEFANQSVVMSGNNQSTGLRKFRKWVTMTRICAKIVMHSNIIRKKYKMFVKPSGNRTAPLPLEMPLWTRLAALSGIF